MMTAQVFITIFVALSLISAAVTEALKKATKDKISSNALAAIVSVVIGGAGCVAAYVFMGIAFTPISIVAIVCMAVAIWGGSMVGYDKIKQIIQQITKQD